jgi:hypothetical protein
MCRSRSGQTGDPPALRALLDYLWQDLEGRQPVAAQQRQIDLGMSLIPGEDEEPWYLSKRTRMTQRQPGICAQQPEERRRAGCGVGGSPRI